MKEHLTLHIWNGEPLATLLELPMTPEQVAVKYGYVLMGIPMAVLKTVDGVAAEINPLGNMLAKLGVPCPDDYLEWAKSPVTIETLSEGGIKVIPGEVNPKLAKATEALNAYIPQWQKMQNKLQQIINYSQGNLAVADAIRGISVQDGLENAYKDIIAIENQAPTLMLTE